MYTIKTSASFDSAHFLYGYNGKCSNLHGHRWEVSVEISAEKLIADGEKRGMICDFSDIKSALKEIADFHDHALIYENGTLKETTIKALNDEDFRLISVEFRPTAENFAKYFYDILKNKGFSVLEVVVYETPNNSARYFE